MANKITIEGTILLKSNTASGWDASTVLSKGEAGVEVDTGAVKFGDGVTTWENLPYAKAGQLYVARNIAIAGDAIGNADFDGTKDITITVALNELLSAAMTTGTLPKLTIGKDGRITAVSTYTADEIIDSLGILDSNGKLLTSLMPSLAISETHVVASESEMLALDAQEGDVAVRTDENKTYILSGDDPSVLSNWVQIVTPAEVVSINGQTGNVVLTTDDIDEGTKNLYYTDARVDAEIEAYFASHTVIVDGNY